jgi:UDP-N-acetylglucosamine 4,6-dehydratase
MEGGEIFVPKIPSMRISDLARAIAPECGTEIVGIRPGEKLHEVMISEDDARLTVEHDDYYAILPAIHPWDTNAYVAENGGKPCPDGFRYSSDKNTQWLSVEELRAVAGIGDEERNASTGD